MIVGKTQYYLYIERTKGIGLAMIPCKDLKEALLKNQKNLANSFIVKRIETELIESEPKT